MQTREYYCLCFTYEIQRHREIKCQIQGAREASCRSSCASQASDSCSTCCSSPVVLGSRGTAGQRAESPCHSSPGCPVVWLPLWVPKEMSKQISRKSVTDFYNQNFFSSSPWHMVSSNSLLFELWCSWMLLAPVPVEWRGTETGPHWNLQDSEHFNILSEQVSFHCTYVNLPLSRASVQHIKNLALCPCKTTFKVLFLNDKFSTSTDWHFSASSNCII